MECGVKTEKGKGIHNWESHLGLHLSLSSLPGPTRTQPWPSSLSFPSLLFPPRPKPAAAQDGSPHTPCFTSRGPRPSAAQLLSPTGGAHLSALSSTSIPLPSDNVDLATAAAASAPRHHRTAPLPANIFPLTSIAVARSCQHIDHHHRPQHSEPLTSSTAFLPTLTVQQWSRGRCWIISPPTPSVEVDLLCGTDLPAAIKAGEACHRITHRAQVQST